MGNGRLANIYRLGVKELRSLWADKALLVSIFVALTFLGTASLWAAIAADMGASLLVVANALRLLRG